MNKKTTGQKRPVIFYVVFSLLPEHLPGKRLRKNRSRCTCQRRLHKCRLLQLPLQGILLHKHRKRCKHL